MEHTVNNISSVPVQNNRLHPPSLCPQNYLSLRHPILGRWTTTLHSHTITGENSRHQAPALPSGVGVLSEKDEAGDNVGFCKVWKLYDKVHSKF
jgi:hypothetical protein